MNFIVWTTATYDRITYFVVYVGEYVQKYFVQKNKLELTIEYVNPD